MVPSLPTIAHALWILVPRKYRLSATLAGSAYHVSLAGGAGGVPRAPPRAEAEAGLTAAGGGGMQRRRKVPDQSSPAAFLAAPSKPSTVFGEFCAPAGRLIKVRSAIAAIGSDSDFMVIILFIGHGRRDSGRYP